MTMTQPGEVVARLEIPLNEIHARGTEVLFIVSVTEDEMVEFIFRNGITDEEHVAYRFNLVEFRSIVKFFKLTGELFDLENAKLDIEQSLTCMGAFLK